MEVLSVKEVAKYLNCSESTIRKMVREMKIPCFRLCSKISFYKRTIDEWIEGLQKEVV